MEARSGIVVAQHHFDAAPAGDQAAAPAGDQAATGSFLRSHRGLLVGLAVGLAVWCCVDVARRARVDPERPWLHMTDFTVYTEAGRAFFDGRDPYEVSNVRGWKYLYPPLFALLVAPLASLPTAWQAAVWFALSSLLALGCWLECRFLWLARFRRPDTSPTPATADHALAPDRFARAIGWGAALAVLFPALNCLQRGQMGIALVYPLLVGFRLVLVNGERLACFAAGLVLALPVALKLTPALPVASLLLLLAARAWHRSPVVRGNFHWRFSMTGCGVLAGVALFFLLLPAALVGWQANLRHLATWHDKVASKVNDVRSDDFGGHVCSVRNQSLGNALYRFGNWCAALTGRGPSDLLADRPGTIMPMDAPLARAAVDLARGAYLPLLAAVIWVVGRRHDPRADAAVLGLACAATLVTSPVARGHYYVFWLPGLVFVSGYLASRGRRRAALAMLAAPALLTVGHYAWLDGFGRVGVLGIGTSIWLGVALLLVGKPGREPAIPREPHVRRVPLRSSNGAARGWLRWALFLGILCGTVAAEGAVRSVTPHYARAAAVWLAGAELYSQDGRGFLYFPQAAMLYAPFLRLPDLARELAWRSAMVGLFACGVAGLCRLTRPGAWGKEFCFVSLVAMPLAWSCARNGQTTLALAGLAMLAACSLARGTLWRSAALLALAAAFKPLGVVVACLACFARRGLWLRVLAMMVLAAAIPLALKDPRYVAAQYKACAAMLAAAMHLGVTRTWAQLFGLATTAGFSIAPEVQLAVRLLAAACLGVLICRLRCRLPPGRAAFYLYALTTLYLLLFNPRTENNSYAMLGPSLGVALAETWRTPGSKWRLLLLVAVGAGALGSFEIGRAVLPGVRPVWVAPVMGLLFAAELLVRLAVEVRRNCSLEPDVARRVGGAPANGAGREDHPPSAGAPASLVESA